MGKPRRRHPPRGAKRGRPRGSKRGGGTGGGGIGRTDISPVAAPVGGKCFYFDKKINVYKDKNLEHL